MSAAKSLLAVLALVATVGLSACSGGDSEAGTPVEHPASVTPVPSPTYGPDTDDDGVEDAKDAFPSDPSEWNDLNGNGIGDKADKANEAAAAEQAAQDAEAAAHASYDAATATDAEKWEQYQWLMSTTVRDVGTHGVKQKEIAKVSKNLCDNSASDMAFYVDASRMLYPAQDHFEDDMRAATALTDAYCPEATQLILDAAEGSTPGQASDSVNDTVAQVVWGNLSPSDQANLCGIYDSSESAARGWVSRNLFLKAPGVDAMMRLLSQEC